MSNDDIIAKLNRRAEMFSNKHGELMCLRANIAAINMMLVKRNRGEELMECLDKIIDRFEKNEDSITRPK